MKKIILLLILLALCAAAILTAPAIITGVALLFTGVNVATNAVGLPHWLGVVLALSLLPTTLVLTIKSFSPKFRKWAAIGFLTLAVAYGICAAAIKHKDDFVPVLQSVLAPVEKWEAARHDKRLAELTSENESTKQALQSQQQQLQIADAALRAEKAARLREQQAFLDRLLKQLDDGQKGLTVAVAKMEIPSLQSVVVANQRLAEASNALSSAMTNGSSDLPRLQMMVEGAISNSDKAQIEIQTASAAQETAKQAALDTAAAKSALEEKERQDAAQLQKLADERQQQAELAARNAAAAAERQQAEQRQPDPPPVPAYTPPPVVPTTTYVVNVAPPQPVYYYSPPPPPQVRYYYYYPQVRTYWVAPRPYVVAPSAPRYYYRRW